MRFCIATIGYINDLFYWSRSGGFGEKNKFVQLPLFTTKMWASRCAINGALLICSTREHCLCGEESANPAGVYSQQGTDHLTWGSFIPMNQAFTTAA